MLIVISSPTVVVQEAEIINNLLDEGLQLFHLRKPDAQIDELKHLLGNIKPGYWHKIALHQHHELAKNADIKRLHFTEKHRKETSEEKLMDLKANGYILSTSIHWIEERDEISSAFDYAFFGPVFDSISKKGYTSTLKEGFVLPKQKIGAPELIAIGGIATSNIGKIRTMGFQGAAVLGTIWENPAESIQQFKALQKAWNQ
jgi:thiamine-phosphate pyrophosphorylase